MEMNDDLKLDPFEAKKKYVPSGPSGNTRFFDESVEKEVKIIIECLY